VLSGDVGVLAKECSHDKREIIRSNFLSLMYHLLFWSKLYHLPWCAFVNLQPLALYPCLSPIDRSAGIFSTGYPEVTVFIFPSKSIWGHNDIVNIIGKKLSIRGPHVRWGFGH